MGRPRRGDDGGLIYHVLNRANARMTIFEKDRDYEAFERVLIRDALNRHFGGEKTARNQLGLTHKEWSDLGRIANKEPIEVATRPYDRPPRMNKVGYLPSPGA